MNPRAKNSSWLLLRPWLRAQKLRVDLGILVAVSMAYWLISRISDIENQKKIFQVNLRSIKDLKSDQVLKHSGERLCETVHVAMSCMRRCSSLVTPMLKSMLLHRQQPLHFHLVVDATSNRVLSKLFDTWDLPDVKYTCYRAEYYLNKIRSIPNTHSSGIYALVKLMFPKILPEVLSKVIVLDSDLTFQTDVGELWGMFSNDMTDEQFIGLVENESDWYLHAGKWPALGRGYNTGVMLLDLYKIRNSTDWDSLWHGAFNENLKTLKTLQLGDQDVINAIIKTYPKIVFRISCKYNVQTWPPDSLGKSCYGEDTSNIKIIHWCSPNKYNIRTKDSNYFKNIHQWYVNFDGNLLKEKLHVCHEPEAVTYKMNNWDPCQSFRSASRLNLRTHLYYMDYSYTSVGNFDVTLVVQLSMDRLHSLDRLVKHWEGPISAAIYLSDSEVPHLESFIVGSDSLSMRTNIGYHLVFKNSAVHYPVNYLRNVALENVDTPYVFLMDVDLVPMSGLYKHLRTATNLVKPYPGKKCLVVAAFETQRYRATPPRTKAALLSGLKKGDVAPFRVRKWTKGHWATNYTRWAGATRPYKVEWESDFEPYLVVHRSVPKYDTRFSGFLWNKVSHGVELRARGYQPLVLPGAFVLHTPHAPSLDIITFRPEAADPHFRFFTYNMNRIICLSLLQQEFMQDLNQKYNITFEEPKKEIPKAGLAKILLPFNYLY